jgi:hypothetical protein
LLCERLPQNVIEPTEKTAPPAVVPKYTEKDRGREAALRRRAPPGGELLEKIKLLLPEDWEDFLKSRTEIAKEWDRYTGLR